MGKPDLDESFIKMLDDMADEAKQRQQVEQVSLEEAKSVKKGLFYLIGIYEAEAARLKSEMPHDGNLNLIDAYNKGRLMAKQSFVDDLKLLIDECRHS